MLQFVSLLVGSFVVAFVKDWVLTFVASVILPIILVCFSVTLPILIRRHKAVEEIDERATSLAGEIFGSIRTVVAFGAETKLGKQYAVLVNQARVQGLKISPLTGAQFAPIFFALYCGFSLTFWYGIKQYSEHKISSVGVIVTVLFSVMMAVMSIGNIMNPLTGMMRAASASTALFQTIDAPKLQRDGKKAPEVSAHEDISFENVDFHYPSRPNVKVLDNLNVLFEANKITAIVGPSGSGKSTIVGLLQRWYRLSNEATQDRSDRDSTSSKSSGKINEKSGSQVSEKKEDISLPKNGGAVRVGKNNILDLDQKWWRQQIGLVQQEPFLFNDTIFKNVSFGLIGTKYEKSSDAEKLKLVKEACREAYASEYIERLPDGYETTVGESGIKLSGGQRQRLAIARSIVSRPPILILDEATSAIDVRGERIVQEALDKVSRNRTTIVIAHRLSTIKKADKIVVMQKGKVMEQGTHENLLKDSEGVYYKLVHAQKLAMAEGDSLMSEDELRSSDDSTGGNALELEKTRSKVIDEEANLGANDEDVYVPKGAFSVLGKLIWEQRKRWPLYLLLTIASIGAGAGSPVQAYLFSEIITAFTAGPSGVTSKGNFWALMFFILAIAIGSFYFLLGFSSYNVSVRIATAYRKQYFLSIIKKRISFFDGDDNSPGTLVSRLQTDPTQLQEVLGGNSATVCVAVVNLVAGAILGFAIGWRLAVVAFFVALPLAFGSGLLRLKHELQFERMNNAVFSESAQFATEAVGAFRTVSALTLEDQICDRYALLLHNHVSKAFAKARVSGLVFALSDSVEMLAMALTFWYGSRLIVDGVYGIQKFFIIYTAVVQGGTAAGQFSAFAPNVAQATAAANRILSFRQQPNSKSKDQKTIPLDKTTDKADIEFKNVYFRYPTRSMPVFQNLNLKIKTGQFVALVGPSGCGKTTIVSLLERFYDITGGKILFNGTPLSDLDTAEFRSILSLVAQEPTLYQGTVRENVLLGIADPSTVSDKELIQACKAAEMHTFISSLPESYNTQVGTKGVSLSGGQKQRLAIARALIRQPRILLLDEATSSLDSQSEKLVQLALERAAKDRTMVVVAHRLATIQKADVIYVFGDGGKVLEVGSHHELLAKRGVYFSMVSFLFFSASFDLCQPIFFNLTRL
jgi:ATP-binding cassette subfamily B (MDR/TAP) protein 1